MEIQTVVNWKESSMEDQEKGVPERKVNALFTNLGSYDSIGVAFSGGVDSTLLLAAAKRKLGKRVVALTAVSSIHPSGEKEMTIQMADQLGVRHVLLASDELEDPLFRSNPVDRCYYCKLRLFMAMRHQADDLGLQVIAHGANLDDLQDYRPGFRAAHELNIVAPLIEAGFTKEEIRQLARQWRLANWDRPAMACLATRIPYGRPIRSADLRQIDRAELFLHSLGVGQCRVRHYGDMARIEVDATQIFRLADPSIRLEIVKSLRALGYEHVCLDLEGYASGKMNRGNGISEHP